MNDNTDVLIIGAGPGGLACAKILAESGRQVTVLERKKKIGPKVCAGGITWSGLINHVPENLIERSFSRQYIFSNYQQTCVSEKNPIVATIDRKTLGQWMAGDARKAGATIETSTQVMDIGKTHVIARRENGEQKKFSYRHLVGADGSTSLVRRFLNIPTRKMGIGINYQFQGEYEKMEWHLNTRAFGYGYGWIFPHRSTISIGAYGAQGNMSARRLKKQLIAWSADRGFNLEKEPPRAALINFDYQGFAFDTRWLIGDAAGLASGLTGEGIYPAIVSGEAVAKKILDPAYPANEITMMVKKQSRHQRIIKLSARNKVISSLLMESFIVMLRLKILDFHTLEMAECP
ncbi:MAG: NAD(P)-binding protein [Desulfobulbaceae bacterium]|nr:NAD(P)-binding protein [Desulfobulbaceae bacterium]